MRISFFLLIVTALLFLSSRCSNKVTKETFDPEKNLLDTIMHRNALNSVFHDLEKLKEGGNNPFSIVHIGDSHIEIGQFSGEIKHQLEDIYGQGEEGWMFPYQLFNSQSIKHFPMDTSGTWKRATIKEPNDAFPLGMTGLGCYLVSDQGVFHFTKSTHYGSISSISFLHYYNNQSLSISTAKAQISTQVISKHTAISTLYFSEPMEDVSLTFNNTSKILLYALKINAISKPGIVYNKFGVAGSTLDQFINNTPLFMEQMTYLKPNMLLISLGTNDSYIDTLNETRILNQLALFIQQIHIASKNTSIIFTTAPDTKYQNKRPQRLTEINRIIRKTVSANPSIALWDLHEIMGGDNSVDSWNRKHLLNNDILHFTPKGYKLQGQLFMKAFLRKN